MKSLPEFRFEMLDNIVTMTHRGHNEDTAEETEKRSSLSKRLGEETRTVRKLYKLAVAADKLETKRVAKRHDAKLRIVPTLAMHQRVEKALKNVLRYIKTAESIYPQLPRPRKRAPWVSLVKESKVKADEACRDIRIETALLVGEVDPSMQNNPKLERYFDFLVNEEYDDLQKKWVDEYQKSWSNDYDLDHFRSKAVEQWLVWEADSILSEHLATTEIDRHKIIQALLKTALQVQLTPAAIGSILYRRKKYLESHQK